MSHPTLKRRNAIRVTLGGVGIFMVLFGSVPAFCGLISNHVTTRVSVDSAGRVAVENEISNQGNVTAHNVTITNFLGNDGVQSDVLGKNPPGRTMHSQCRFDTALAKPGSYLVVSRINFTEENGTPHAAYHFAPFRRGSADAGGDDALAVRVAAADINLKSPLGAKGVIRLTIKNGQKVPVDPVVFLAAPEGLQIEKGEERFHLAPGEEIHAKIPVAARDGLKSGVTFPMMVRYETDTAHYAKLVNTTVHIEERPVLFKLFLIAAALLLAVVVAGMFCFRRKKAY